MNPDLSRQREQHLLTSKLFKVPFFYMGENNGDGGAGFKHLLEHEWSLWFDDKSAPSHGQDDYGNSLKELYTIKSVE